MTRTFLWVLLCVIATRLNAAEFGGLTLNVDGSFDPPGDEINVTALLGMHESQIHYGVSVLALKANGNTPIVVDAAEGSPHDEQGAYQGQRALWEGEAGWGAGA